jgi:hypothetical protein
MKSSADKVKKLPLSRKIFRAFSFFVIGMTLLCMFSYSVFHVIMGGKRL